MPRCMLQGRRDGSVPDEPLAWESREFLRKLAIGKSCIFRVDYKIEKLSGREFGTVFIDDQNVSTSCLLAGWAKVREGGAESSPFYDQLIKSEEYARSHNLGLHNNDPKALRNCIRSSATQEDASSLLKACGKGGKVTAIVDAALSGSMLAVTLPDSGKMFIVMVAGVQCPNMGKRQHAENGTSEEPQPFAREAKWLAESLCLNREVILLVHGVSEYGAIVATVLYSYDGKGGVAERASDLEKREDLAASLMEAGLARVAEWSSNMMAHGSIALREAERSSKVSRRGMWYNHVPQAKNASVLNDEFMGQVMEIVSGDCLIVNDCKTGIERRVILSSVHSPRPATRARPAEPWGQEAKEFLRRRLIGREVNVRIDYSREVVSHADQNTKPQESKMLFGTVKYKENKQGQEMITNVAELMLAQGLASIVRHGADDERSPCFVDLGKAEETGKARLKGLHSKKLTPEVRFNDLTIQGSASKARQHLPFLQRAGKMSGVCEYVLSGSRLKIFVPKESALIIMSPNGVKCPGKDEDFSREALLFTRSTFLQRDVNIVVENIDRSGAFLGRITTMCRNTPFDLGIGLLESGLATLHGVQSSKLLQNVKDLRAAEDKAKSKKCGIWSKPGKISAEQSIVPQTDRKTTSVVITEMVDPNNFYVQFLNESRAQWIADQVAEMALDAQPAPMISLKPGDICLAKFDVDNNWYRAKVMKNSLKESHPLDYKVFFIDFGNTGRVGKNSVRSIPQVLSAVPPQAHMATLAFSWIPKNVWDEVGGEAMERVAFLTKHGSLKLSGFKEACSKTQDGTLLHHLTLFPGDVGSDISQSINADLIRNGLAKSAKLPVSGTPESESICKAFQAIEQQAVQARRGIFEYGDIDSEEENEDTYR